MVRVGLEIVLVGGFEAGRAFCRLFTKLKLKLKNSKMSTIFFTIFLQNSLFTIFHQISTMFFRNHDFSKR